MVNLAAYPSDQSEVDPEDIDEPDDWKQRVAELQERYTFYIMNPARQPGVEYSLWIHEGGDREYPVVNSNTGGFVTFNSRSDDVGDGIDLTEEFFYLVGFGWHEAMCFIPEIYFRDDHFEHRYNSIYGGRPREHEVWLAHVLIDLMCHERQVIPELRPLCEWADGFSDFDMPRLAGDQA